MSDLIDRIDLMEHLRACNENGRPMSSLYDVGDLIAYVERMPTASPWHRVEEPPKEEGKYLVYDGRGNYFVVWWGPRLGWCYDPKFFCYWMPIEPPKEDA